MPKTNLDTHYTVNARGCWMWKGGVDGDGYGHMSGNRRAHRVYYARAHGEIPDGMCVCHKCDTPRCVNPDHLFLATSAENTADKMRKDRHIKGEEVKLAKLTDGKVREILASNEPCFILARRYGVSDAAISFVRLGKTWKHVPRPPGYSYVPYRAPGDHKRYEELAGGPDPELKSA